MIEQEKRQKHVTEKKGAGTIYQEGWSGGWRRVEKGGGGCRRVEEVGGGWRREGGMIVGTWPLIVEGGGGQVGYGREY